MSTVAEHPSPAGGQRTAARASRAILTAMHDIMAARAPAQAKLNRTVDVIAGELDSEVCSIYLRRDGVLELYATHGLAQEAVHVTRLAMGEGLVGTIAAETETLNLAEAAAHPDFAYRPETGEDLFHSFAGVPIVRRQAAVGVLSVQHRDPRRYDEVEIEALQTVAMVLAELIQNADLIDADMGAAAHDTGPLTLTGQPLVVGMGRGRAVYHQPRVQIDHTVADDPEAERARVQTAFDRMREQIERIMKEAEFGQGGEQADVLATYRMFAYDEGWIRRIEEAIDSGLTAEAAIERVQQRTRMRMRQIADPLLAERMHDLEDLSNRLLRIVSGQMGSAAQLGLRGDTVLLARNLGPAELLEYDRRRLKGVILEEGSLTAHVTIVARAMGVPMLGRVGALRTQVRDGDEVLLDAGERTALIRPGAGVSDAFVARRVREDQRRAALEGTRALEPVTRDGTRIAILVNAGLRQDVNAATLAGADGIGLFRTEFQFLVSATMPQRERQQRLYRDVMDAADPKPVVFRTVDIGGDKALPYMKAEDVATDNPAMGWRAVRVSLDRGGLMKAQARALLEASAGRTLHVMFPMISEVWEFEEARALFEAQAAFLRDRRRPIAARVRYGAMLEVPALAEVLDALLPQIDFLSVGTNDLTQFLFAADRAHPKLADRYDWLSPAILRFLRRVVAQVDGTGVDLTVCGEMGGRPLEALALLAVGYRRLSITPAAVAAVKAAVRSVDLVELSAFVNGLVDDGSRGVRDELTGWLDERAVGIGSERGATD